MLSIAEQGSGFRYIWGTARIYVRLAIVAILSSALSGYAAPSQPRGKNVLVLFGALRSDPEFMDLIVPLIRARVQNPTTFYEEYLVNYPSGKQEFYQESKAETFRRQYAGAMRPDVVIAVRPQATLF